MAAPFGAAEIRERGMAFLSNGDIVITDKGRTNGPIVMEVNPNTGARTLVSGDWAEDSAHSSPVLGS
jgi:hypothetical protein